MIRDQNLYSVLIIEDNLGDFILISDYLNERFANLTIVRSKSYAETVKIVATDKTPFDIVLLDLSLPDNKGETLIKDILNLSENSPVIVLTGYTDITFSIKSLKLGVSDYLLKDEIDANSLYKSIIYAFERMKYTSKMLISEKKYSQLFHFSPIPKILYDIESLSIIQVNNAAILLYGYTENDLNLLQIGDLCFKNDKERFLEYLQSHDHLNTFEQSANQFKHLKSNKQLMDVEIHKSEIQNEVKNVRLLVINDITEKRLFTKKMNEAILKTQEDERNEIGAELHDNVCQLLATSQLCLSMLEDSLSNQTIEYYNRSQEIISMALDEIRNLSHQLAPVLFVDSSIEETLNLLLRNFNILNQYEIQLIVEPKIKTIQVSKQIHLTIFRIIQEQLRNIQKHSKANGIIIKASVVDELLEICITDNGVGFDMTANRGGIGFSNMKRRLELLDGNLKISSIPNQGCKVKIEISLKK